MIIDSINLNHLRIFECVYRVKSMTAAAQELHLTQSGVSQHVKAFEDALGVRLFDRVKQRLLPTSSATQLFERCSQGLYGIEQALIDIKGGAKQLAGTVSVGMPIEFGNNLIAPLIAQFCEQHPRVRFSLRYGFATEMNQRLLSGELDFAFVDSFGLDKRIETRKVYDEVLYLCMAREALKKRGTVKNGRKYFESLEYAEYESGEPVLRMWFEHHLGVRNLDLNVRATVMDVQGVARLILTGELAGVLPGHLISKLQQQEGVAIYSFKGCGDPLKNSISVATLVGRTQSHAAASAMRWIVDSIASRASPKVN